MPDPGTDSEPGKDSFESVIAEHDRLMKWMVNRCIERYGLHRCQFDELWPIMLEIAWRCWRYYDPAKGQYRRYLSASWNRITRRWKVLLEGSADRCIMTRYQPGERRAERQSMEIGERDPAVMPDTTYDAVDFAAAALARLTPVQRQDVIDCVMNGTSTHVAALARGVSHQAVSQSIHAAIRRLREIMEEQGNDVEAG